MSGLIAQSGQAESLFSIEGELGPEASRVEIPFRFRWPGIFEGPLEFRTWSHSGGVNHAGDLILAGGFDPTLTLSEGYFTDIAFADNGAGAGLDALLSLSAGIPPIPMPLLADNYSLMLEPATANIGTSSRNWAVDIAGPDDVLSLSFHAIDRHPSSSGISKVSVIGSASHWAASDIWVGEFDSGTLHIESGGTVSSRDGYIGFRTGSTGAVTVEGNGSIWSNSRGVQVGRDGSGTLLVRQFGVVESYGGLIGGGRQTTSQATITGSGSQWINTGAMLIGSAGDGVLRIENGGTVSSTFTYLGNTGVALGSIGRAVVTGAGSLWTNTGSMHVGNNGEGVLSIEAGARVTSDSGFVGDSTASLGSVVVTGAGSEWLNEAELRIGDQGAGELSVNDGGLVANTTSFVGYLAGSSGEASVVGLGSRWTNSGGLYLGGGEDSDGGLGRLSVGETDEPTAQNGQVLVGGDELGFSDPAQIVVSDTGANGVLYVRNGSTIDNVGSATIGASENHVGEARVIGPGSRWNNDGTLHVAKAGLGTLRVQAGGEIASGNGGIGVHSDAVGGVAITGAGSRWNNQDRLTVGEVGHGSLYLEAGGQVASGSGVIGAFPNSVGEVTVSWTGSQWANVGRLDIGALGDGILDISFGGAVISDDTRIGVESGSSGEVTVRGNGSLLESARLLVLGGSSDLDGGVGTLTLESDGRVQVGDDPYLATNRSTRLIVSGQNDVARLVVRNGSIVSNDTGFSQIGSTSGHEGQVTITGAGSRLDSDGVTVGYFGSGELQVEDGGVVTSFSVGAGMQSGSLGTLTVQNPGSSLNVNGWVTLGGAGRGALQVQDGGEVSSDSGLLGIGVGSVAEATVTGHGATWTIARELTLGLHGNGTLRVENGGVVSSTLGYLGSAPNSTGEATVTGSGSKWNNSADLIIGASGEASLRIESGGVVSSAAGFIGWSSASTSNASVSGNGSEWNNSSDLYVGGSDLSAGGAGELSVLDNGLVSVAGTLKVWSTGHVTLNGGTLNGFSLDLTEGAFEMLSGTLRAELIVGSLDNQSGTLAPAIGVGLLTITGDLLATDSAVLEVELAGSQQGDFDQLIIAGEANLSGVLDVSLLDGFEPSAGDTFDIVDADGGVHGQFATAADGLPSLPGFLAWEILYEPKAVTLAVVSTGLAGDYNADGVVNAADYTVWKDGGSSDAGQSGYDTWATSYGFAAASSASDIATQLVPEPTATVSALTLCLIALGGYHRIS